MKKFLITTMMMLAMISLLASCQSKPEEYTFVGAKISGQITLTSLSLFTEGIKFTGRVTIEPNTDFRVWSQEEGVYGGDEYVALSCDLNITDPEGNAYINCSGEHNKKLRHNAIVLSLGDNVTSVQEDRVVYRPNEVRGPEEELEWLNFQYDQLGLEPNNMHDALLIHKVLGMKVDVNRTSYDYTNWPEDYLPHHRGFFVTLRRTDSECNGNITDVRLELYKAGENNDWVLQPEMTVLLESVNLKADRDYGHTYDIDGIHLRVEYLDDSDCNDRVTYVELP